MGCILNGFKAFVGQLIYSPPYWDDMRVPATTTNQGPANRPDFIQWGASNGVDEVYAWHFAQNIQEDLYWEAQFPHDLMEGSDWEPHVHWSPINTNVGDVVWRLSFRWAPVNGVYPLVQGIDGVATSSAVADTHQAMGLPTINGSGAKISTMLTGRISRMGNDPRDTLSGDVVLHEVDFHYRKNTPGSRQQFIK